MIGLYTTERPTGTRVRQRLEHVLADAALRGTVGYFSKTSNGHGNRFVEIGSTAGQTISTWTGAHLTDAGVWQSVSDASMKENFQAIDKQQILERLAALPVHAWRYRSEANGTRHIGPTAQDFKAAFNLGMNDTTIGMIDADGVALAAIQGLKAKVEQMRAEKDSEIIELRRANDQLRTVVELLLARIAPPAGVASTH